jgi:hypothetical protein
MLSTDRAEFESQLAKLCAGLNVPATSDRIEAYWTGLSKMSLLQFVRCIDHALSEDGPEKFPTVPGMWKILRASKQNATQITQAAPAQTQDHLLFFANRMFWRILSGRIGEGMGSAGKFKAPYGMTDCHPSAELSACRKAVQELVEYFTPPVLDGDEDATPHAFISAFVAAMKRCTAIDETALAHWRGALKDSRSNIPFPKYMARPLGATHLQPTLGIEHAQS